VWLSFAVWVITLNSWTLWMHEKVSKVVFTICYWTDTYTGHCPSFCFTVAQHLGNSLQNMFYRQCPVFNTCVSYATLRNLALNFWSHLRSLTANQECRMCGDEKGNWYTMMKTIYTKWKLGGRLYAVTLVLTPAIIPSCSWPFIQQVCYSNADRMW